MYHHITSVLTSNACYIIPLVLISLIFLFVIPDSPCKICKRCGLLHSRPDMAPPPSCPLFGGSRHQVGQHARTNPRASRARSHAPKKVSSRRDKRKAVCPSKT